VIATNETCSVYSVQNMLNGMFYVGVSRDYQKRFKQHCMSKTKIRSYLSSAIKQHGKGNFTVTQILIGSREYCLEMERKIVETYECLVPNGYNLRAGGTGCLTYLSGENHPQYQKSPSPESIEKVRRAITGKKLSPLTEEHKEKISITNKNNWSDPERSAKRRAALAGRKKRIWSEEHLRHHRERMKAQWADEEYRTKMLAKRRENWTEESYKKQAAAVRQTLANKKLQKLEGDKP
jgi:hypothetical protein